MAPPEADTNKDSTQGGEIIAAVSIQSRLLPFWRELPAVWFIQFEAVIEPLNTSDDQKCRYLLQQLKNEDLRHVADLLKKPPTTKKYEALKSRLISVYEESDVQNFQKLISGLELGDQKPSQLLRKMRELGGQMITEDGLKIEWLKQMHAHVRSILAVNSEATLDTLAIMADKMMEFGSITNIAAVSTQAQQPQSQIETLSGQLEKLTMEVAELRRGRQRYQRNTYRWQTRSRSRSRGYNSSNARNPIEVDGECWYHKTFGSKARRCEPPCLQNKKLSGN